MATVWGEKALKVRTYLPIAWACPIHGLEDLRLTSLASLPGTAGQGLVFNPHHGGKWQPTDPAALKLLQQLLPLIRRHPNPPLAIRFDYIPVSFDHICHSDML